MPGALLTDLYQLTMLQACFDRGMNDTATVLAGMRQEVDARNRSRATDSAGPTEPGHG